MKRVFTSAVAALMVVGMGAEVEAQGMDGMNRRVPRFELGVYGGGAYTTPWYDFRLESSTGGQTSRVGDGDDIDFGFDFAPIFGVVTKFNFTPRFGVRLHGAYMPSALPHAENADWDDGYPQNNYFYDLDLVLSTPTLPLFSRVLGNAYVFIGGGGLTTNIADSGLVPENSDRAVCEPGTLRRGACLPLQGEYATVGQGTVGIGGDLFSLASNVGVFVELAAHGYDSPVHTGDNFVPRITVRPGAAFGVAGDTFAVRLLYRGQPLAGARVHASGVPMEPGVSPEAAAAQAVEATAETDAQGVARIPVGSGGLWNVRAIHIVPADPGSGADWDTHWASLVFGVGPAAASHGPTATPAPSRVLGTPVGGRVAEDSVEVANTVDRFHRALGTGDTATAMELLVPDAVILESGGVETHAEYRSHHLPGDVAFARAVPRTRSDIGVRVQGDVAWATSTSTVQGEFRGRAINSQGAELMVLRRTADGWKIAAIHWSSRSRRS
jgi:ketosteroid isomerase-like protein